MRGIIIAISLFFWIPTCLAGDKLPNFWKLAQKIMGEYSQEMRKKHSFEVAGSGGSAAYDMQVATITYAGYQSLNIDEARRLFIEVVDGLAYKFNKDKVIRPFLHDYPFTRQNIDIALTFKNGTDLFITQGKIAHVAAGGSDIIYSIYNSTTRRLETVFQEPYEEALRIVREEKIKMKST